MTQMLVPGPTPSAGSPVSVGVPSVDGGPGSLTASVGAPGPAGRRGPVVFGAAALAFAVLALVARVASADGAQSLSLIWPAGGVGLLWYLVSRTRLVAAASLLAAALIHAGVMLVTDSGPVLAAVTAAASVVQTFLAGELLRRFAPELLRSRGPLATRALRTPAAAVAAVAVGALVAAGVGSGAVDLLRVEVAGAGLLFWWGKQLTGTLLVAAVGYVVWSARTQPTDTRVHAGPAETTALLVLGSLGYGLVFLAAHQPFAFVLILLAVWAGARLATWSATLFSAACGVVAIGATIAGRGPFTQLATPQLGSLVTQAFVLTVLLTTLAVAIARDARLALAEELAAANLDTARRAELLDAMTESMTEGIVVVDEADRLIRSNRAAREMLEPTETGFQSSVEAYRVFDLDGEPLEVEQLPARAARVEGRPVERDIVLRDADGSRRVLAVRAVPLGAGGDQVTPATASVVVYRDVTQERRSRDRLAAFAETVAHDLRNPLTAARGWVEQAEDLAVDVRATHPDDPLRGALSRAQSALERMTGLIAGLLASAKSDGLDLRPVSTADVVRRVASDLDVEPNVVVGDLPDVLADPDLLHQLLTNLIGNACKYVADGTDPRIEVTADVAGGQATLRVSDNGIGVPPDQRSRIFDRRHRVPGPAEAYDGTGLGLAICRDIAERHGGSIRCEGSPSGGSTFVVELPAAPADRTHTDGPLRDG